MGVCLAKHLLDAGYVVYANDIDEEKVKRILELGAKRLATHEAVISQARILILSLPNSHIVRDLLVNRLHLLEGDHAGLIVVDTTTADPDITIPLAIQLKDHGIEMLDATISGTSEMCAAKDAIFMVGGTHSVFENCYDLLSSMSREVFYMGESGTGTATKLVVNLVLAINRMGLAEGLTLARKAGLDPLKTLEILKKSAAGSKAMDQKGYRMVNETFFPPIGHLSTHYKDVKLILSYAASLNCPMPLASVNAQALASEMSKGRGDRDSSAIISFYNDISNLSSKDSEMDKNE
jgi:3-hydroxyisobutyrate dehydrogenase-like beta-hydroxyacid dehydrogenase